eukprot:COSAG01_NODE_58215_length_307_cov_0.990385_1_plen_78_part_01
MQPEQHPLIPWLRKLMSDGTSAASPSHGPAAPSPRPCCCIVAVGETSSPDLMADMALILDRIAPPSPVVVSHGLYYSR